MHAHWFHDIFNMHNTEFEHEPSKNENINNVIKDIQWEYS